MNSLDQRVYETWAHQFHFHPDQFNESGTTLLPDSGWDEHNNIVIWHLGKRAIVRLASLRVTAIRAILAGHPADHAVTGDDLLVHWPNAALSGDKFYILDPDLFQPQPIPDGFTARVLGPDDQAAFDAMQANCSAQDLEDAQITLGDELVVGVLAGEHIVALSSTFEWKGFTDIGILTDPSYRGRGLGTACVSFLCTALLSTPHERVIIYRHEHVNLGSQSIAERINFRLFADVEVISTPPLTATRTQLPTFE